MPGPWHPHSAACARLREGPTRAPAHSELRSRRHLERRPHTVQLAGEVLAPAVRAHPRPDAIRDRRPRLLTRRTVPQRIREPSTTPTHGGRQARRAPGPGTECTPARQADRREPRPPASPSHTRRSAGPHSSDTRAANSTYRAYRRLAVSRSIRRGCAMSAHDSPAPRAAATSRRSLLCASSTAARAASSSPR
jgi:hypothetical protein